MLIFILFNFNSDDDVDRKKRERLQVYLMNSQATSSCTGSRYTKVSRSSCPALHFYCNAVDC